MDHQQKNSFCQTTKQPSMTQNDNKSKTLVKDLSCYKLKSPSTWHFGKNGVGESDLASFQWPPRSYTCSFCKREFRSAQALGGHMNVHRRDRARLNQSPIRDCNHSQFPFPNLNLDHNPSFACRYTKCPSLPPLFAQSPVNVNADEMKYVRPSSALDLMKMKSGKAIFEKVDENEAEFNVRLDLEVGLIDDKSHGEEEELDLELRLGYC